tara:strand:+ start:974 stop:1348 length:375 start_codon:yes stop_codon:yes gene_type:complete
MSMDEIEFTSAVYGDAEKTFIKAVSDGKTLDVPISFSNRHYASLIEWEKKDGNTISNFVAPSITWDAIRAERNKRLSRTDWVVSKSLESSGSVSTDWKNYRQSLRDITTQSDPNNITWPTEPSS